MTTINLVDLSALPDDLRAKVEATCPTERGAVVWKPESHYKSLDALERLPEEFRTRRAMRALSERYTYRERYDTYFSLDVDIPRKGDPLPCAVLLAVLTLLGASVFADPRINGTITSIVVYATLLALLVVGHRLIKNIKKSMYFKKLQRTVNEANWFGGPIPFTRDELDTITAARMTFNGDDPECALVREADELLHETSAVWERAAKRMLTCSDTYSALSDYLGWSTSTRTALALECAEIRDLRAKGEPIDESMWETPKKRLKSMTEYRDKARARMKEDCP